MKEPQTLLLLCLWIALIGQFAALAQPPQSVTFDSSLYQYLGGDEFSCNPAGGNANPNAAATLNDLPRSSLWQYDIGYMANNELEFYTGRPKNNFIGRHGPAGGDAGPTVVPQVCAPQTATSHNETDDGVLYIMAHGEPGGYLGGNMNVSSARLTSRGQFCIEQGMMVQFRYLAPAGRGTWPAIWLLGPPWLVWPKTGEIDMFEDVGFRPDLIFTTIHGSKNDQLVSLGGNVSTSPGTISSRYYNLTTVWNTSGIFFFVDETLTYQVQADQVSTWLPSFAADRCYELIVNLAIGGDWGGQQGIDWSMFPVTFAVDYIRVYRAEGVQPTFLPTPSDTMNVFPNATEFAVARCDSTESLMAQGGWRNATIDRIQNQRFNAMIRNASISMIGLTTPCGGATHASNLLFASSLSFATAPAEGPIAANGYVFVNPGGGQFNDLVVANNPTGAAGSKRLQSGSGYVPFVSAELQIYSQGLQPLASSCCVVYRSSSAPVPTLTPAPGTSAPSTTTPAPSTTPAPPPQGSTTGWGALSLGAKSGIIAGAGVVFIIIVAVAMKCLCGGKGKSPDQESLTAV